MAGVNVIAGGTGNDVIDGAAGADVIAAGAGNDSVTYYGSEASIDGGVGSDTLVMTGSGGTTAVNFAVTAAPIAFLPGTAKLPECAFF